MKLTRTRPRRSLVNITPLIDVVFILLVFFMLAGAIKKPDPVPVDPPTSEAELEGDEEDLVILITADGTILFNDTPVPDDGTLVRSAAVWIGAAPGITIQLKADGNADAARVIEIMGLLRQAGARSLVLLTIGKSPAVGGTP